MISCKAIQDNGNILYFNKTGLLHREDGPAIEYATGLKAWVINNKYHRLVGPAIEYPDGSRNWYINGEYLIGEEEFKRRTTRLGKILYL